MTVLGHLSVHVAQAMLAHLERLVQQMRAAGVADPVALIRQSLAVDLAEAHAVPLLAWAQAPHDAHVIAWREELHRLMVTFDVGPGLVRPALTRALGVVGLFQ